MNTHLRGIGYILASGVFLSTNDAIFKSLVAHYPPGQILFTSGAMVALLIWIILKFRDGPGVVVNNWPGHISRGLLFVVASFAFVISLQHLTLAETVCIAFAGPLCMTIMARFWLHEQVGFYRLAAVIVGFVGVVIMIQPGTSDFRWIMLLPLVVAVGDAARDIITRKIAPTESSLSIVFTTSVILAAVSLLSLFYGWNSFQKIHFLQFTLGGAITVASYFCMVEAYRNAPTVVIAPFRYIQIIWGVLAGFIIWGEIPGQHIFIGLIFTIGAGLFIAFRESRVINKA